MNPQNQQSNTKIDSLELDKIFGINNPSPIQFVNTIITEAIQLRASDVLFEPRRHNLAIRARIDGVLYLLGETNIAVQPQIISRIKILSKLDPTEKRQVQEGQFSLNHQNRRINCRVEIAQVVHGEIIVIRIHEQETIVMELSQLGFSPGAFQTYQTILKQKSGLVLVCGPTGSGKTTTLYSTLSKLNEHKDQNILTVENPVEYQLENVNQMQVDETIGFTFAQGLKTILRLTPDIVFVGEIRDRETARIAIESGLTGQLVFSTAHAEDSIRTIFRLTDLDVETYFLNSALAGIVGQRLVRKVCESCKVRIELTQQDIELYTNIIGRPPKQLVKAKGCPACNNIGYKGRIGIYEVLFVNTLVRDLIRRRANEKTMRETLIKSGFVTMLRDGLEKAEQGITTTDEVLRNSLRVS